jgi:hypothetical protein
LFRSDAARAARAVTWLPALQLCNGGGRGGEPDVRLRPRSGFENGA